MFVEAALVRKALPGALFRRVLHKLLHVAAFFREVPAGRVLIEFRLRLPLVLKFEEVILLERRLGIPHVQLVLGRTLPLLVMLNRTDLVLILGLKGAGEILGFLWTFDGAALDVLVDPVEFEIQQVVLILA